MKKWGYGVNTYFKTANIHLDILPRHLYCIERAAEFVCSLEILKWIKFPDLNYFCFDEDGKMHFKGNETTYTLKEWWGDLGQWTHCTIHMPIFKYVYNSKKCKSFSFNADYEELKNHFIEIDKEYWKATLEMEEVNESYV